MRRHDYFEVLFLDSGEFSWQIQDKFLSMAKGDLCVVSSTLYHRPIIKRSSSPVKAVVLYFLPDLIRGHDSSGADMEYLMPFLIQDAGFPHIVPSRSEVPAQVLDFVERIHRESPPTSERSRLCIKTYLKMILVLLVNHYASYPGTSDAFSRKQRKIEHLRPVFEYLEDHYNEPVSIQHAASIAGMSRSHFMRFFKQVTGQPFISYLNHFRIAKAQSLLAATDKSISEISQEVGFCDQSYFGAIFLKVARMTPLQYRHQATG